MSSSGPIEIFPFKMSDPNLAASEGDFRAITCEEVPELPKESVEPSSTADASTPPTPTEEKKKEGATESASEKNPAPSVPGTPPLTVAKSTSLGKTTQPA